MSGSRKTFIEGRTVDIGVNKRIGLNVNDKEMPTSYHKAMYIGMFHNGTDIQSSL